MANESVSVSPSFRKFSVDLLSQMLQNFLVVKLVNHLALGNKFLINNDLTVKIDHHMLLMFDLTCLNIFWLERMGFST